MAHLTTLQWVLIVLASVGLGMNKAGLAGINFIHILVFALLFGARDSTGIVLPMLIVGDFGAVAVYRRHARWDYIRRMLPATGVGIVIAAATMRHVSDAAYKPLIGWIILGLILAQISYMQRPSLFGALPHSRGFAWAMGLLAGAMTMFANAAGPIVALYALALGLPKYELVGTNAWLFLIINLFKVPFSAGLGLIHTRTLLLDLTLVPAILTGLLAGLWIVGRIPQRLFNLLILIFAAVAALRLVWGP